MRMICACSGILILAASVATAAENETLCALVRHEEGLDLEFYQLESQRAEARFEAARRIFKLVDDLWQEELVERIIHLRAKHDLDVATLDRKRQQLLLKRQQALMEIYDGFCRGESDKAHVERAHAEYALADCHRAGKDLAIAEADLAFNLEWLSSVVDLRENGVVPEQDVILAEEQVEVSRREIRYYTPRVQACKD